MYRCTSSNPLDTSGAPTGTGARTGGCTPAVTRPPDPEYDNPLCGLCMRAQWPYIILMFGVHVQDTVAFCSTCVSGWFSQLITNTMDLQICVLCVPYVPMLLVPVLCSATLCGTKLCKSPYFMSMSVYKMINWLKRTRLQASEEQAKNMLFHVVSITFNFSCNDSHLHLVIFNMILVIFGWINKYIVK